MAMTDDRLIAIVDNAVAEAHDHAGKLARDRQTATQYYNGEATGDLAPPEISDRSSVVSNDVMDTIEWAMPSLMKIFTGSDDAVEFEPQGPEDEKGAQQRTDYANYIFYRRNPGFLILHTWFKDALLYRLGVVKTWWDPSVDETREEYKGLTEEELVLLTQDPEVEIIESSMQPGPTGFMFDITAQRTKKSGRIRIENVVPEQFFFDRKAKRAEDLAVVGERLPRTISDLKAAGYKNVDQIGTSDNEPEFSQEATQRANRTNELFQTTDEASMDESQRKVWLTECYIKVDYDGDGIAEWRRICKVGKVLLANDEVDSHPYDLITPILMSHELVGKSLADIVMDLMRIKTALLRQTLDNLYIANNATMVVLNGKANVNDVLERRTGGVIRVDEMGAVQPLVAPSMAGDALQAIEYLDTIKENRTGITRYNQGMDANSLNKTASGISQIMGASQQRLELIARVFADTGVKSLFRRVIKLASQFATKEEVIRLRNEWTPVDPRAWKNEYDLTVNVGLGTGSKETMAQHLMGLMQIQKEAIQIGVATPKNIFEAAKKYAENVGFKNGEIFFTDPEKQQPQPPKPDPEIEKAKIQAEQKAQAAQMDAQLEKYKADLDAKTTMETAQMKMGMDVQIAQMKLGMEAQIAQMRAAYDGQIKQMNAQLEQTNRRIRGGDMDRSNLMVFKYDEMGRRANADSAAS